MQSFANSIDIRNTDLKYYTYKATHVFVCTLHYEQLHRPPKRVTFGMFDSDQP